MKKTEKFDDVQSGYEKLIDSVSDCGWGFYDTLQDIYSEYR